MAYGRRGRRRKIGWSTDAQQIIDRVFVYGTLREGQAARSMIANHVQRSRPATMQGRIYAFPEGYPGMVESEGHTVQGEVLELGDLTSALALLDAYEGEEFSRVVASARLGDGTEAYVWVYVLADAGLAEEAELIESGDWVAHLGAG